MNRLIIIGNGFDLAHGLPTRYNDFIKHYLEQVENQLKLNQTYEDDFLAINREKIYFPSITLDRTEYQYINFYKESSSFRYKSLFFQKILERGFDNWVDLENEYYDELKIIFKSDLNKAKIKLKLVTLNDTFECLKNQLEMYLKKCIEEGYSYAINTSISTILSENLEFYKKISLKKYPNNTAIFNFNYTSLAEKYYKNISVKSDFYYTHGKVLDNENPLIFGFGDEMDSDYKEIENLNENEFFKNIKSFKYSRNSNYQNAINFLSSDTFEVYIMGHSCGLSDRTLLNNILEHENCKLIKIFYYKNIEGYNTTYYNMSRHFEKNAEMRLKVVPFDKSIILPQCKLKRKEIN